MSQTETHFGKLRKVEIPQGQTLEQWCREKCEVEGYPEIATYNDNWLEQFRDVFHEKYFFVGNEIWEAFDHHETEDDDIYHLQENEDGTLTFIMQFYNGGTCLTECIEESLENLNRKK